MVKQSAFMASDCWGLNLPVLLLAWQARLLGLSSDASQSFSNGFSCRLAWQSDSVRVP